MSLVSISKCYESDGVTPKADCFIITDSNGNPYYVSSDTLLSLLGYVIANGKSGGQTIKGGTGSFDDLTLMPTSGNAGATSFIMFRTGSNGLAEGFRLFNNGNVGFGSLAVATTPAKVTIEKTDTQLRVGYNSNVYFSIFVDADGKVNVTGAGDDSKFKFNIKVNIPSLPPTSATDIGEAGDITWDADYIYMCVAANTWKRTAVSSW